MKVAEAAARAMNFWVPLILYHQHDGSGGPGGPLGAKGTSGSSKKVKVGRDG